MTSFANELMFAGYRRDAESSIYHVRNRMFHPTLGGWAQRDPLNYHDAMNLYEYVGSSPGGRTDPSGLTSIKPPLFAQTCDGCFFTRAYASKWVQEEAYKNKNNPTDPSFGEETIQEVAALAVRNTSIAANKACSKCYGKPYQRTCARPQVRCKIVHHAANPPFQKFATVDLTCIAIAGYECGCENDAAGSSTPPTSLPSMGLKYLLALLGQLSSDQEPADTQGDAHLDELNSNEGYSFPVSPGND